MSFQVVVKKLLQTMKQELQSKDNVRIVTEDIIQPIVKKVVEQMYPYFLGAMIVFSFIILSIFIILFLNVKICYYK